MRFAEQTRWKDRGSVCFKEGRPLGKALDRSGLGQNFQRRRISRAMDGVPHGGPMWTYTSRGCCNTRNNTCLPERLERSRLTTVCLGLCAFLVWSIPVASKPTRCSDAQSPAEPAHISAAMPSGGEGSLVANLLFFYCLPLIGIPDQQVRGGTVHGHVGGAA